MTQLKQTPSQTIGPYFAYGLCPEQYNYAFKSLFHPRMAEPHAQGVHITITGRVFDGEGKPVNDAMLEMLHLDADGHYPDTLSSKAPSAFRGFSRVGTGTNPESHYVVDTIKPGPMNGQSAPCIEVILHMRGLLHHLYTRIYFDDEQVANERDALLAAVPTERRDTLMGRRIIGEDRLVYRFDIHLQGPQETVFFDI